MNSFRTTRTAVIGVGNMGKNHARVYHDISTLSAISDTNQQLGNAAAKKFSTKYYEDYKKMLDREKPDAVSVVVPTPFHKEIVLECLKRHIPTLVEKPIASTISDAKSMLQAAITSDTYLLVGHIERFNPAVIQLKKLIDNNKIGKLISLLAIRVGISPPLIPHANVIVDLGIHDVDIFNYLLEEFPNEHYITKQKIFTHTDVDSGSIHLRYPSCQAIAVTNWVTPIKIRRLYATGTEGFIELDYISQKITYYSKIVHTISNGDFFEFISLLQSPQKKLYISKKEPLKEEIMYFLKNKGNKPDKASLLASIEALKIVTT